MSIVDALRKKARAMSLDISESQSIVDLENDVMENEVRATTIDKAMTTPIDVSEESESVEEPTNEDPQEN